METFERHTITEFTGRPIYGDQYFFWEHNTVKRSIWSGAEHDICRWHDKNVFFAERQAADNPKRSAERDYAVSLQRAIEYFCADEDIPEDVIDKCPHHAKKLIDYRLKLKQLAQRCGDHTDSN